MSLNHLVCRKGVDAIAPSPRAKLPVSSSPENWMCAGAWRTMSTKVRISATASFWNSAFAESETVSGGVSANI
jgi:hypothetical protein